MPKTRNNLDPANESNTSPVMRCDSALIIRDVLSSMLSWNCEVRKSFYATQSRNVWKIIAYFLWRLNSRLLESCSGSSEHLTDVNQALYIYYLSMTFTDFYTFVNLE